MRPRLPAASRLSTSSEMPRERLEHAGARAARRPRSSCTARKFSASSISSCVRIRSRGQILLVVLEHDRQLADVHALAQQVVLQVLQALQVVVEAPRLAVGDEDDAVGALQHQLPGGVVVALPRDGVELELGGEAGDRSPARAAGSRRTACGRSGWRATPSVPAGSPARGRRRTAGSSSSRTGPARSRRSCR